MHPLRDGASDSARVRASVRNFGYGGFIMRILRVLCLGLLLSASLWAQNVRNDVDTCDKSSGDEAIAACTRAIQSGQLSQYDLSMMYNDRGVEWKQKGEYDKAMADYNEALRIQPIYREVYNNRGNVWKAKGEYDKAIADYNEAIREASEPAYRKARAYANPYHNRGLTWQAKGEYDKAIADYTQFIAMEPNKSKGYCSRSEVWNLKHEAANASADAQRCKELGGK